MDGESSCDSDISESWSLIDLNISEQISNGSDTQETALLLQPTPNELIKNEKLKCRKTPENFELMEYSCTLQPSKTENASFELSDPINSFSNSYPEEGTDYFLGKVSEIKHPPEDDNGANGVKFDDHVEDPLEILSDDKQFRGTDCDTDGISVISEGECDDPGLYCCEVDKNWEQTLEGGFRNNLSENAQLTVISKRKRKKKKAKSYSDSSDDNVESNLKVPDGKYYSNVHTSEVSNNSDEMQVKNDLLKPVYRHYRNNVANTVLSLSMGVVFAGVACIALGHFLGVHDAEQTAGEMMEALKRLQMENILLQTRLTHISRAFFTRENIVKSEPLLNIPENDCKKESFIAANNVQLELEPEPEPEPEPELKPEPQPGPALEPRFKSLDRLSVLRNLVNDNKYVNVRGIGNVGSILDRLQKNLNLLQNLKNRDNFNNNINNDDNNANNKNNFNNSNKNKSNNSVNKKLKFFEDLDLKISKFLEKFSNQMMTYQANIQSAMKKLTKLNEKLNKKLCKNFRNLIQGENLNCDNYLDNKATKENWIPVRESDLNMFQWYPVENPVDSSVDNVNSNVENVLDYKFPQPESYYVTTPETKESVNPPNVEKEIKTNDAEQTPQQINSKEGLHEKDNYYKKPKPKKFYETEKNLPKMKLENKNRFNNKERKNEKKYYDANVFKNHDERKKHFKTKRFRYEKEPDDMKHYYKGSRETTTKPSYKPKKRFHAKSDFLRNQYRSNRENCTEMKCDQWNLNMCLNTSGSWVEKIAEGREEWRRYHTLSDWQFERARGREELRKSDVRSSFPKRHRGYWYLWK